jgi:hypothetical protein
MTESYFGCHFRCNRLAWINGRSRTIVQTVSTILFSAQVMGDVCQRIDPVERRLSDSRDEQVANNAHPPGSGTTVVWK